MNKLPKDPVMLLSVVNTHLRDFYPGLDEFCKANEIDRAGLEEQLKTINYEYDENRNQFV